MAYNNLLLAKVKSSNKYHVLLLLAWLKSFKAQAMHTIYYNLSKVMISIRF